MPSAFDSISQLGPAGLVVEALVATAGAIGLLLAFILLRRAIRSRYFRRLNHRTLEIRHNWEKIVGGVILPETWFNDRLTRNIVESMLLDRLEVASAEEIEPLHQCLRFSGLLDARIHEARLWRGWRRRQALLSLGRMRVPEGISALAEALDDASEEIRVAGIRGLGRVELPKAAEPILERLTQGQFNVPVSVVQSALLGCFRAQPSLLLPYVHQADDRVRPLLARVLAEVATPGLEGDLLSLASDPIAEVRASAARALAEAKPPFTLSALTGLAADEEWFVRLRAVIAIGRLHEPHAIPVLLQTLGDRNRHVRLRSAAALVGLDGHEEEVLHLAMQMGDRYALQALVSEMERSGRIAEMVNALRNPERRPLAEAALVAALRGGANRILVDLMLHHSDWRIRGALARLLAGTNDKALLDQLQRHQLDVATPRQQRVVRWLMGQLRSQITVELCREKVLA
jgi:HEAT repeat protein